MEWSRRVRCVNCNGAASWAGRQSSPGGGAVNSQGCTPWIPACAAPSPAGLDDGDVRHASAYQGFHPWLFTAALSGLTPLNAIARGSIGLFHDAPGSIHLADRVD